MVRIRACALVSCSIYLAVAPAVGLVVGTTRPAIYGRVNDDVQSEQADTRHAGDGPRAVVGRRVVNVTMNATEAPDTFAGGLA
jgi:hypothetical protein